MRYLVFLLALTACAQPRDLAPAPAPTVTVTVIKSVELPCPEPPSTASVLVSVPVPVDPLAGRPAYVIGAGTLRLGVMHSEVEAKNKLVQVNMLIGHGDGAWATEIWRTSSGKDAKVTHRVQVRNVDSAVGDMLCAWLETKGWKPGAVPCEMRK